MEIKRRAAKHLYLEGPFAGEKIELEMTMRPERIYANGRVRDCAGQTAFRRGPVVYCAEEKDNGDSLHLLRVPREAELAEAEGFAGYCAVETDGYRICPDDGRLYSPDPAQHTEPARIRLVPYCMWGNRGRGEMRVFLYEG